MVKTNTNIVSLVGNVNNIQIVPTGNGREIAKFSLAVNNFYEKNGLQVKDTHWHNVITFKEELIENLKSFPNGTKLMIEGRLEQHKYKDKDGKDRTSNQIMATKVTPSGGFAIPDQERIELSAKINLHKVIP